MTPVEATQSHMRYRDNRGNYGEFCAAIINQAIVDYVSCCEYFLNRYGRLLTDDEVKDLYEYTKRNDGDKRGDNIRYRIDTVSNVYPYIHRRQNWYKNKHGRRRNAFMKQLELYLDVIDFMGSDWYWELTDMNPSYLLKGARKKCKEKYYEEELKRRKEEKHGRERR